MTSYWQQYQIFAFVASQALGGKKKKAKPPETAEEAMAQFKSLFRNNK